MTEAGREADGGPTTQATVPLLSRDFDSAGLTVLRHDVTRHAERSGLVDLTLYGFVVAVHEISTNAVRHGGGSGRLTLWRTGDRLYCRITDRGGGMPPAHVVALPPADAVAGRGLWLADHACEMTSVSTVDGTTVTLASALSPQRADIANPVG